MNSTMKRIAALLLAVCLLLTLAACGKDKKEEPTAAPQTEAPTIEATAAPSPTPTPEETEEAGIAISDVEGAGDEVE